MVPANSISQMIEIIDDENKVHSYSTEQIKDILYTLQHEDLTENSYPLFSCLCGIILPVNSNYDMEKIIRLEKMLTAELQERGEYPTMRKFS